MYLGNKGFTVLKTELGGKIHQVKRDLTATIINKNQPNTSVAFYRESHKKMYLPRYYGISKFGIPENKLSEGENISLTFSGSLRPIQEKIVESFLEKGNGLIEVGCGQGKTICALNIIQRLGKKTLVVVHKEFLLNQWIERITEFLPNARIGKIQGQNIDIENKDIVIGMLQSLSMKEYNDSVFSSFGLIVFDEVHHISSEIFSNFLFKVVTNHMLGLSATMVRKDGTTPFFKMFLGDVVYKQTEKESHNVIVRAYEYKNADPEFNEVEYDVRGNVKYSTMITKLCAYHHRTEFVLNIIAELLKERPANQIMVIAHNKSVLKYIHDAVSSREMSSVGYYVGGMKEKDLKESEKKSVIIATYSMAAEALDIKTLTTLIMVTPKTDIEQAVGRILREKHSSPIVVDIVDTHSLFKNQWKKRKTFYNSQKYKIEYMNFEKIKSKCEIKI
jgi:superfamily II DNA or RNA helicase